jgi:hypothetical protein
MNRTMFIPLMLTAAILFGACGVNIDINIDRGSGIVVTEGRSVESFDRVVLTGIGDVTIVQGDQESLEIEAEDNVIPFIRTNVRNGILEIGFDRKSIIPTKPIKFRLTMRSVRGLDTNGVSNIQSNEIATDRLEVSISGTGSVNIRDLTAEELTIIVSGAGNCTLEGTVDQQRITLSGAGNYDGENLESSETDITITGLGKVTVWATNNLNVTISGTGGVDYYGNPQVRQQISGLGRVKDMGLR